MAICAKTKHSMLRRCNGWDYRQPCIYQITLVLAEINYHGMKPNDIDRLVRDAVKGVQ